MNLTKNIILLLAVVFSVSAKKDRIRLKDVETLTLYADRWTSARRSAAVKQLTCVGGSCNQVSVQAAQCYNRGFDGNDIQWECKAELPSNYKFGRLEVSCEGYEYPDDDYILAGSCGLEYTISEISKSSSSYFPSYPVNNDVKDGYGSSMMTILVVFVAAAALYFYLRPSDTPNGPNVNDGRSRFNSNPSAPPPPGFRPDYYSSGDKCNTPGYGTSSGTSTGPSTGSSSGTSNRPGFFSGMATGGLMGYLFGSNRGNNGYARRGYQDNSYWNRPSSSGYSSFGSASHSGGSRTSSATTTSTSTSFASTKRR